MSHFKTKAMFRWIIFSFFFIFSRLNKTEKNISKESVFRESPLAHWPINFSSTTRRRSLIEKCLFWKRIFREINKYWEQVKTLRILDKLMNGLGCSDICRLFLCPPCPSKIAAKVAFLPPEPSYSIGLFLHSNPSIY